MSLANTVNPLFRYAILAATQNRAVEGVVRSHGMQLGAARFVAGERFSDCAEVLASLDAKGLHTNTTVLGESVEDQSTVDVVIESYLEILDQIAIRGLKTNIALKLTHLGLEIGEDLAYHSLARIVERAEQHGNFIRIDMEESARVDATLSIYRKLRESGFTNVGTVLQSCLYRSESDLHALMEYQPNLRLVKGAYLEPADIAFPRKRDVDLNYLRLARYSLSHGEYTAIATHDERIINFVIEYTERNGIERDRFEFQMLYGIRPEYQVELERQGYKVLVATPYGPEWYYYLMRRLAERPANLLFLIQNILRR